MKSNLWIFGDSLSAGFLMKVEWCKKYIEWKNYIPKSYGELISEELNLNLINLAEGGLDNYSIFEIFCNNSHKIKKDDYIIFGWSSPVRFRLVTDDQNWIIFIPNFKNTNLNRRSISENTINEILLNRNCFRYSEEVNSWIKMINNLLKDNLVTHWTAFDDKLKCDYVRGLETIHMESNGIINDQHFSEKGQYELSKILLNRMGIKSNKLI